MVIWQDIAITIANLIFAVSLIPQVIHGFKSKKPLIKIQSSLPTAAGLYLLSFAFFTLGLYFSSIISSLVALSWTILFIQGIIYKHQKP